MSKHPNEQVLTDGLLLERHTTLQLVSVSPTDVSQENFPTVLVGHVAGMPWEQQASRNVFFRGTDKFRLPVEPVGG